MEKHQTITVERQIIVKQSKNRILKKYTQGVFCKQTRHVECVSVLSLKNGKTQINQHFIDFFVKIKKIKK